MIQRSVVIFPKSAHKERVVENFSNFDFDLSSEDMETIKTLDTAQSLFIDHLDMGKVKWHGNLKFAI